MFQLQLFAFDSNNYCDFTSSAAKAVAGKDILLAVFNADGFFARDQRTTGVDH